MADRLKGTYPFPWLKCLLLELDVTRYDRVLVGATLHCFNCSSGIRPDSGWRWWQFSLSLRMYTWLQAPRKLHIKTHYTQIYLCLNPACLGLLLLCLMSAWREVGGTYGSISSSSCNQLLLVKYDTCKKSIFLHHRCHDLQIHWPCLLLCFLCNMLQDRPETWCDPWMQMDILSKAAITWQI